MPDEQPYDAAILGGGPGGLAAAGQVARRGGRACLIEAGPIGGACLNVGCIPAKAMLHASGLCRQMRQAGRFGLAPREPAVDGAAFMQRVGEVVSAVREGARKATAVNKRIDLIRGRGRLVGPTALAVATDGGEARVEAGSIIIATGSRPVRPRFLPWGGDCLMTSDEATTAGSLPESVLVIGGGVIGCEFATAYAELGIRTHLVEMLDRLLPDAAKEASEAVTASLTGCGAEVLSARRVLAVTPDGSGAAVELDGGRTLAVHRVLVAVGREARTGGIGLEDVGVEVAGGIIPVDGRCRTNVEGVYAVGDVAEPRQYAHLADQMGIVAAENAMGHELHDDRSVVPVGVYTHPEIASVGLDLAEAKRRFGSARAFRATYKSAGMAVACAQTEGLLKVVAAPDTGRIYGALWIGPHATDMIQEFALAIRCGLTLDQIHHTIHPHPTFQEAAATVAAAWAAQASRKRP